MSDSLAVASLVSTVAFIAWIAARLFTNLDDAYITFTYARNLARGLGFVYYPTSPVVLGTSTPLWTLYLALLGRIGVDIPIAATITGGIAHALTSLLILRLGNRWGEKLGGLFAATLYAISLPAIATSGMETAVYTLAIVLALYLWSGGHHILAWLTPGSASCSGWMAPSSRPRYS